MQVDRATRTAKPFLTVVMTEAFITKVNQSATDEGNVLQKVEMVFKNIEIEYWQQGVNPMRPGSSRRPERSSGTSRPARRRPTTAG